MKRIAGFLFVFLVYLTLSCPYAMAQGLSEPSWPQNFTAGPGEPASFGFAVTQPGAITVTVTAQGPVLVTLGGPLARPLQQQGSGIVKIAYSATPADIQKSCLWTVLITAQVASQVVSGTIAVQHPPADPRIVAIAIQNHKAALKAQEQANLQAYFKTRQVMQVGKTGQVLIVTPAKATTMSRPGSMTAANSASLLKTASSGTPFASANIVHSAVNLPRNSTSSLLHNLNSTPVANYFQLTGITGIKRADANGYTFGAAETSCGSPGCTWTVYPQDEVLISGSGLQAGDEVHFVVSDTADLVAVCQKDDYGSNYCEGYPIFRGASQPLYAVLPYIDGVQPYAGAIYVKRGTQRSNLIPINFQPIMDVVTVSAMDLSAKMTTHLETQDWAGPQQVMTYYGGGLAPNVTQWVFGVEHDMDVWLGHKGDDTITLNYSVLNGWVLDSVTMNFGEVDSYNGYLNDSGIGTSNAYAVIHWWADANSYAQYFVLFNLRGPRGVPYR